MIQFAGEIEAGSSLACDVCVVGAGAAGISLAQHLDGSRLQVCLLESGGLTPDARSQDLCAGRSLTLESDAYLGHSRLRMLGGSTQHWAGLCAPFAEHDLAARPWVQYSGWPLSATELEPWYRAAQPLCGLGRFDYALSHWNPGRNGVPPFSTGALRDDMWQLSPPVRFGAEYRMSLHRSTNLRVVLGATALSLETDEAGRRVETVHAVAASGGRFRIRARRIVLAGGGIENARLLLLSDRHAPGGLGNGHDQVGRYFMDHPHYQQSGHAATVLLGDATLRGYTRRFERDGVAILPNFTLSPKAQRSHGVLAGAFTLHPASAEPPDPAFTEGVRALVSPTTHAAPLIHLYTKVEPAPHPDSRVRLGDEKDALGQRRSVLDWRLTPLDLHSLRTSVSLIAQELGRTGRGRLRLADWLRDGAIDVHRTPARGGAHHMGTTRMHDDPRRGVVDRDARVHGVENLFVAGSSVFPTAGWMNPTLTLVALSLRLADHLKTLGSS